MPPITPTMREENDILRRLTTRVRQLVFLHKETKEEVARLKQELKEKDDETKALQQKIAQLQADYDHLKLAKILVASEEDVDKAKARISKLVRDVNRTIALLSSEE